VTVRKRNAAGPGTAVDAPRLAECRIAFRRAGSGGTLLLIHGIGGDGEYWRSIADRLAGSRDLIMPDLPGHGSSPALPVAERPTPQRLAASLASLLDELDLPRVHVAGVSLGSWIALELAAAGRALSVAALCPSGVGPSVPPSRPPRVVVPVMGTLLRSMRFRRVVLGAFFDHPERAPRQGLAHYSRSLATAPGYRSTRREMTRCTFSAWDAIDVPVTLVWGEHDRQIQRIDVPRPWIRSEVLKDCGHAAPQWDNPEETLRVLLSSSDGSTERAVTGWRREG
jgi:pimeloyl-ACP methyl ester carboxylesterase